MLVHLEVDTEDVPSTYELSQIEVPKGLKEERVERESLPAAWEHDVSLTRPIGDAWLRSARCPVLIVPSSLVPADNALLNPAHPAITGIRIAKSATFPLDMRLLR